jgi:hypothetical protein
MPTDQDILEGAIEGMAHVEASRDIGRGDNNGIRRFAMRIRLKIAFLFPFGIPRGLGGFRIISLVEFHNEPFNQNEPFLSIYKLAFFPLTLHRCVGIYVTGLTISNDTF